MNHSLDWFLMFSTNYTSNIYCSLLLFSVFYLVTVRCNNVHHRTGVVQLMSTYGFWGVKSESSRQLFYFQSQKYKLCRWVTWLNKLIIELVEVRSVGSRQQRVTFFVVKEFACYKKTKLAFSICCTDLLIRSKLIQGQLVFFTCTVFIFFVFYIICLLYYFYL